MTPTERTLNVIEAGCGTFAEIKQQLDKDQKQARIRASDLSDILADLLDQGFIRRRCGIWILTGKTLPPYNA